MHGNLFKLTMLLKTGIQGPFFGLWDFQGGGHLYHTEIELFAEKVGWILCGKRRQRRDPSYTFWFKFINDQTLYIYMLYMCYVITSYCLQCVYIPYLSIQTLYKGLFVQ